MSVYLEEVCGVSVSVFDFSPTKDIRHYISYHLGGGELGAVTVRARRKPKIAVGTGRASASMSTASRKRRASTYIYTAISTSPYNTSIDYAMIGYVGRQRANSLQDGQGSANICRACCVAGISQSIGPP